MVFVDEATVGADLLEASGDPMITTPINAPTCVEEVDEADDRKWQVFAVPSQGSLKDCTLPRRESGLDKSFPIRK